MLPEKDFVLAPAKIPNTMTKKTLKLRLERLSIEDVRVSSHSEIPAEDAAANKQVVKELHECPVCQDKFGYKFSLRRHMKSKHSEIPVEDAAANKKVMKELLYECPVCQDKFGYKFNMQRHMKIKHFAEWSKKTPVLKKFKCLKCKLTFNHKYRLQMHKLSHIRMKEKKEGERKVRKEKGKNPALKGLHTDKGSRKIDKKMKTAIFEKKVRKEKSENPALKGSLEVDKGSQEIDKTLKTAEVTSFCEKVRKEKIKNPALKGSLQIDNDSQDIGTIKKSKPARFTSLKKKLKKKQLEKGANSTVANLKEKLTLEKISNVANLKEKQLEKGANSVANLKEFQCQICKMKFYYQCRLDIHMLFHTSEEDTSYQTNVDAPENIDKSTENEVVTEVLEDILLQLNPEDVNEEETGTQSGVILNNIPGCSGWINLREDLTANDTETPTLKDDSMELTKDEDGGRKGYFVCSICQKYFHYRRRLNAHYKTHENLETTISAVSEVLHSHNSRTSKAGQNSSNSNEKMVNKCSSDVLNLSDTLSSSEVGQTSSDIDKELADKCISDVLNSYSASLSKARQMVDKCINEVLNSDNASLSEVRQEQDSSSTDEGMVDKCISDVLNSYNASESTVSISEDQPANTSETISKYSQNDVPSSYIVPEVGSSVQDLKSVPKGLTSVPNDEPSVPNFIILQEQNNIKKIKQKLLKKGYGSRIGERRFGNRRNLNVQSKKQLNLESAISRIRKISKKPLYEVQDNLDSGSSKSIPSTMISNDLETVEDQHQLSDCENANETAEAIEKSEDTENIEEALLESLRSAPDSNISAIDLSSGADAEIEEDDDFSEVEVARTLIIEALKNLQNFKRNPKMAHVSLETPINAKVPVQNQEDLEFSDVTVTASGDDHSVDSETQVNFESGGFLCHCDNTGCQLNPLDLTISQQLKASLLNGANSSEGEETLDYNQTESCNDESETLANSDLDSYFTWYDTPNQFLPEDKESEDPDQPIIDANDSEENVDNLTMLLNLSYTIANSSTNKEKHISPNCSKMIKKGNKRRRDILHRDLEKSSKDLGQSCLSSNNGKIVKKRHSKESGILHSHKSKNKAGQKLSSNNEKIALNSEVLHSHNSITSKAGQNASSNNEKMFNKCSSVEVLNLSDTLSSSEVGQTSSDIDKELADKCISDVLNSYNASLSKARHMVDKCINDVLNSDNASLSEVRQEHDSSSIDEEMVDKCINDVVLNSYNASFSKARQNSSSIDEEMVDKGSNDVLQLSNKEGQSSFGIDEDIVQKCISDVLNSYNASVSKARQNSSSIDEEMVDNCISDVLQLSDKEGQSSSGIDEDIVQKCINDVLNSYEASLSKAGRNSSSIDDIIEDIIQKSIVQNKPATKEAEDNSVVNSRPKNSCYRCGKFFKARYYLKIHELSHYGVKRYECRICGRGITTSFSLKSHLRRHFKPAFKCQLCNKRCYEAKSLDVHMLRHNDPQPFKCSSCPKSYAHSCTLYLHLKEHKLGRLHQCSICNLTFPTLHLLKIHKLLHYQCKVCNAKMNSKKSLYEHSKMHKSPGNPRSRNSTSTLVETHELSLANVKQSKSFGPKLNSKKSLDSHSEMHKKPKTPMSGDSTSTLLENHKLSQINHQSKASDSKLRSKKSLEHHSKKERKSPRTSEDRQVDETHKSSQANNQSNVSGTKLRSKKSVGDHSEIHKSSRTPKSSQDIETHKSLHATSSNPKACGSKLSSKKSLGEYSKTNKSSRTPKSSQEVESHKSTHAISSNSKSRGSKMDNKKSLEHHSKKEHKGPISPESSQESHKSSQDNYQSKSLGPKLRLNKKSLEHHSKKEHKNPRTPESSQVVETHKSSQANSQSKASGSKLRRNKSLDHHSKIHKSPLSGNSNSTQIESHKSSNANSQSKVYSSKLRSKKSLDQHSKIHKSPKSRLSSNSTSTMVEAHKPSNSQSKVCGVKLIKLNKKSLSHDHSKILKTPNSRSSCTSTIVKENVQTPPKSPEPDSADNVTCQICNRSFELPFHLKVHLDFSHPFQNDAEETVVNVERKPNEKSTFNKRVSLTQSSNGAKKSKIESSQEENPHTKSVGLQKGLEVSGKSSNGKRKKETDTTKTTKGVGDQSTKKKLRLTGLNVSNSSLEDSSSYEDAEIPQSSRNITRRVQSTREQQSTSMEPNTSNLQQDRSQLIIKRLKKIIKRKKSELIQKEELKKN